MTTNLLINHAKQLATPMGMKVQTGFQMNRLKVISDAAIYCENGTISTVGSTAEVNDYLKKRAITPQETINATGQTIIPGFIDSHTHFLFSGFRPKEFVDRLDGKSYLEIMASGGGIESTVQDTRKASFEELFDLGYRRLSEMLTQGITTVEGKSGYGLDYKTELKELRVMQELNQTHKLDVQSTYLGAHAFPKEYDDPNDYIEWMISTMLPEIKKRKLSKFVDVFCDQDVYDYSQTNQILTAAKQLGFQLKLHADEIKNLGGVPLATSLKATSVDHLLTISKKEISQLSNQSNTVATLLPATAFCLREKYAPARELIDNNIGIALASDYNPGSAFTCSIPLIIALACLKMKMTPAEILTGLTLNGAAALGIADKVGSLETGKKADLVLLKYPDYKYLIYHTGMNIVDKVIKSGKLIYKRND